MTPLPKFLSQYKHLPSSSAVALVHQREPDEKLDNTTQRFTNGVYVLVGSTGRVLLSSADGIDSLRVLTVGEQPF